MNSSRIQLKSTGALENDIEVKPIDAKHSQDWEASSASTNHISSVQSCQ